MLGGCLLDHSVILYDVVLDEAPTSQRKSDLNTIRKTSPGTSETPSLCYMEERKLENLLGNGDGGLTEEELDSWVQRYELDRRK